MAYNMVTCFAANEHGRRSHVQANDPWGSIAQIDWLRE